MGLVKSKRTFHTRVDGRRVRVKRDEVRSDTDPVVKRDPGKFTPVEQVEQQPRRTSRRSGNAAAVESATAAPGERRTVSRPPAKKAAPAKKAEPKPSED